MQRGAGLGSCLAGQKGGYRCSSWNTHPGGGISFYKCPTGGAPLIGNLPREGGGGTSGRPRFSEHTWQATAGASLGSTSSIQTCGGKGQHEREEKLRVMAGHNGRDVMEEAASSEREKKGGGGGYGKLQRERRNGGGSREKIMGITSSNAAVGKAKRLTDAEHWGSLGTSGLFIGHSSALSVPLCGPLQTLQPLQPSLDPPSPTGLESAPGWRRGALPRGPTRAARPVPW